MSLPVFKVKVAQLVIYVHTYVYFYSIHVCIVCIYVCMCVHMYACIYTYNYIATNWPCLHLVCRQMLLSDLCCVACQNTKASKSPKTVELYKI